MKPFQIETWARRVIDRVEKNQPNEDFQVELKAEWPEADRKTARRIAAHANAARGEPILWLIGVDQKASSVIGVEQRDVAKWYQQIQAEFSEQVSPSLKDINLPHNEKTVVALFFETDRFPYVVKSTDDILEVPWREGTRTRSAKRSDLMKLLLPLENQPQIEILSGEIKLVKQLKADSSYRLEASISMYFEPKASNVITIPFHRCSATVITEREVMLTELRFVSPYGERSPVIHNTHDEIHIQGPGKVQFFAYENIEEFATKNSLQFKLTIPSSGSLQPIVRVIDFIELQEIKIKNPDIVNVWGIVAS